MKAEIKEEKDRVNTAEGKLAEERRRCQTLREEWNKRLHEEDVRKYEDRDSSPNLEVVPKYRPILCMFGSPTSVTSAMEYNSMADVRTVLL